MPSPWQRAYCAIAARIGLAILLAGTLLLPGQEPRERDSFAPGAALPAATEQLRPQAISVKTAGQSARPGERIPIGVDTGLPGAEAVLIANGVAAARQRVPAGGRAVFELAVPAAGPLIIGAELRDAASQATLARIDEGAVVNVVRTPSIAVLASGRSPYADSVRRGGWTVAELTPATLPLQSGFLPSLLVLDDIAANDLPAGTWQAIEAAIRTRGMGLLVLGGARSFGLGAYRGSELEALLPVVSEPPRREPPVSVMFLVDVSGSMDQAVAATSRLRIAQQAVVESSKSLRPVDRVGLMSFEIDAVERLPLAARPDHGAAIEQTWPAAASGGTRLAPALARAVEALERESAEEKLLVVLTDGDVDSADLAQLEPVLAAADVVLVGLIVNGGSGNTGLSGLIRSTGGRARVISDLLHLPHIMRAAVEDSRPAIVRGPAAVTVASATPWLPIAAWAPVDNYLLTRPTQDATVHMTSDRGDVVLAIRQYGAGRVAALTTGLSGWTAAWLTSEEWPDFIAGLTGHLAIRDDGNVAVSFSDRGPRLVVDFPEAVALQKTTAQLVSPSGVVSSIDLEPAAPRRLAAQPELHEAGLYVAIVEHGAATTRHYFLNRVTDRVAARPQGGTEATLAAAPQVLLALVLFGFVLVLWWERR